MPTKVADCYLSNKILVVLRGRAAIYLLFDTIGPTVYYCPFGNTQFYHHKVAFIIFIMGSKDESD